MLTLAKIFQNGMTFQRDKKIRIWGKSEEDDWLRVYLNDGILLDTKIPSGDFEIFLPSQKAVENAVLRLETKFQTIVLDRIDIGEVWIAGGQSNMEFSMIYDQDRESYNHSYMDQHLRFYDVAEFAYDPEQERLLKDTSHWDRWMCCDGQDTKWFSAVGFHFAKRLRDELNVPVAVVGCNWGGTTASTWMDEKILSEDEILKVYIEDYETAVASRSEKKYERVEHIKRKIGFGSQMEATEDPGLMNVHDKPTTWVEKLAMKIIWKYSLKGHYDPNRPGALYHMMLSQIAGFAARGVIWYQGESDEHHAEIYGRLFEKMIGCWRDVWREELPFIFVQLAPWEEWLAMNGLNYPVVRQQQQIVEDTVPNTYMASIMDLGLRYDIHPKNKKPVGNRLALLALDNIYEKHQKYARAPRMKQIIREGKNIDVEFLYCEDGLVGDLNLSDLFNICQNGKRIPYLASIKGKHVKISCHGLMDGPASISFGYRDYLVMTLKNKGGLTARPFAPINI
ncbi:MAG: sialate O-acetylesterase [Eubacteriales bacterium]|nr:sialate O-acetylesterase [Eubacteriales bacterium]